MSSVYPIVDANSKVDKERVRTDIVFYFYAPPYFIPWSRTAILSLRDYICARRAFEQIYNLVQVVKNALIVEKKQFEHLIFVEKHFLRAITDNRENKLP